MAESSQVGPFFSGEPARRGTAILTEPRAAPIALPKTAPFISPPPSRIVTRWRITLDIDGAPPVTRLIDDQATLGRPDPVEGFTPQIDLTPFSARDKGVSRHHARIVTSEEGLTICDLGSTNGTRLNGSRLAPNHAYRLRDGDQVECGALRMVVKITNAG